MTIRRESRGRVTNGWVLLNLLRLVGLAAILWSSGVHIQLLVSNAKAIQANRNSNFTIAGVSAPAVATAPSSTLYTTDPPKTLGIATATQGRSSTPSSSLASTSTVANAIPIVGPSPKDGVPLAIYPTESSKRRRGIPRHDKEFKSKPEQAGGAKRELPQYATGNDSKHVTDGRYLPKSTVPNIPGGGIFAVLINMSWVGVLAVLLMGQLGIPERFLLSNLPCLSMSSSPLWLGLGQTFAGLNLQSHFIPLNQRVPGFAMMGIGLVNIFVSSILIIRHAKVDHCFLSNDATVYQRFNRVQRLPFWKPMPPTNVVSARRSPTFHVVESEDASQLSKDGSDYKSEYPSFSGKRFEDPGVQIPSMTMVEDGAIMQDPRRLHDIKEDDENADAFPSAYKSDPVRMRETPSRKPGMGNVDSIASVPGDVQDMYSGLQPRFGADSDLPEINIVSPSTIASSSRFGRPRFGRPGWAASTHSSSTMSSAASSRSDASRELRKAASSFPTPPRRPASTIATPAEFLQPRAFLASRIYDKARLVAPTTKASSASSTQLPGAPLKAPEVLLSEYGGMVRRPPTSRPALGRSASEKTTRSVRFEERKGSTASNSSGLIDYIPARATRPWSESRKSPPRSAHFSSFSSYGDGENSGSEPSSKMLSFVSDSQYSSEGGILPLLRPRARQQSVAPSFYDDVMHDIPSNATSPPESREHSRDLSRSMVTPNVSEDGHSFYDPASRVTSYAESRNSRS